MLQCLEMLFLWSLLVLAKSPALPRLAASLPRSENADDLSQMSQRFIVNFERLIDDNTDWENDQLLTSLFQSGQTILQMSHTKNLRTSDCHKEGCLGPLISKVDNLKLTVYMAFINFLRLVREIHLNATGVKLAELAKQQASFEGLLTRLSPYIEDDRYHKILGIVRQAARMLNITRHDQVSGNFGSLDQIKNPLSSRDISRTVVQPSVEKHSGTILPQIGKASRQLKNISPSKASSKGFAAIDASPILGRR